MSAAREITVAELAARLNAAGVVGDSAVALRAVATLDDADRHELSWLESDAYLAKLETTRAGAVLVPLACPVPAGRTAVRVADPALALCEALRILGPEPERVRQGVHPTAIVGSGAEVDGTACVGPHVFIGPRSRIGAGAQLHFGAYVGSDCVIGAGCVLWPHVVVRERVTIGERVVIHANSTIGADGFGYLQRDGRNLKVPQVGTVLIEDDVEIGANSAVDRAKTGVTRIGRGTKVDNLVQIGHNCEVGEHCIVVAQCGISGSTRLGHHVVLAGQVGIVDHLRVGNGVQVGAKAGVREDLEDGARVIGVPALDWRRFTREQAALRRLPELVQQVRELKRRMEQLESATDDPA